MTRIEALLDDKAVRLPDTTTASSESTELAKEPQDEQSRTVVGEHKQTPALSTLPPSSLISLHLGPERRPPAREDGSVYSADTSNLEYVGPRTFLSVCSAPAISWISRQLQDDSFQPVAARLLRNITTRLRPFQSVPLGRKPEPSREDAWRYTAAYFAEAPEAAFGVVNQLRFETMLRKHFQGGHSSEYDAAWYALRNIIFAYGCRILLSKTNAFRKANDESEGWFFNALAVHTDLLYFRTSIMGVQALIIMVCTLNWRVFDVLLSTSRLTSPRRLEDLRCSTCWLLVLPVWRVPKVFIANLVLRGSCTQTNLLTVVGSFGLFIVWTNIYQSAQVDYLFVKASPNSKYMLISLRL